MSLMIFHVPINDTSATSDVYFLLKHI